MKETLVATGKVNAVNATVVAFINAADIKEWASLLLVLLSIIYTVWHWRREAKGKK